MNESIVSLSSLADGVLPALEAQDFESVGRQLAQNKVTLTQRGVTDTRDTDEMLGMFQRGEFKEMGEALTAIRNEGIRKGIVKKLPKVEQTTAEKAAEAGAIAKAKSDATLANDLRKKASGASGATKFQKGQKYLVDGGVIQGRFNPTSGQNEIPDGAGGFRPTTPEDQLLTTSTDLEIGPDGVIRFRTGLNDQTISTQSGLEQRKNAAELSLLEAKGLLRSLSSADVGFRGFLGEKIIDQTLGQISKSLVNNDRVANRQSMLALKERTLKSMSDDKRFSNLDRAAIEKLFPSGGVFESIESAKTKIRGLVDILTERINFHSGKLGRKSFVDMTPEEIGAAVSDGSLDKATAFRVLTLLHGYSE